MELVLIVGLYVLVTFLLLRHFTFGMGVIIGLVVGRFQLTHQPPIVSPGGVNVMAVDVFAAAFVTFLVLVGLRRIARRDRRYAIPFFVLLFGILSFVGAVRGIPQYGVSAIGQTRWYIFAFLSFPVLWIGIEREHARKQLQKIFKTSVKVYATILVIQMLRFVLGTVFGSKVILEGHSYRFTAAADTVLLGGLLLLLISRQIYVKRGTLIPFQRTLTAFIFTLIIFLQHRSVWVAVAVGIGLLIWFRGLRFDIIVKGMALTGAIALIFVLLTSVIDQPVSILESLGKSTTFIEDPEEDATASWRLIGWAQELSSALESPVFGKGYGSTSEWVEPISGEIITTQVHNAYIMQFSKLGVAGVLTYFSLLFVVARKGIKAFRNATPDDRWLFAWLGSFMLMNIVFAAFYYLTVLDWSVMAAILILSSTNAQKTGLARPGRGTANMGGEGSGVE